MSTKAGRRHSESDNKIGRGAKQKAREIVDDLENLGFVDPEPEENALKAISETDTELRVANYIVLFGGRDLEGEYFTPETKLESDYTAKGKLDIDWEHGRNAKADGLGKNDILGFVDWATAKADERGVWVERVLNRSNKYVQWIHQLIKAGRVGSSSEALTARVQKAKDGQIIAWPLYRDSLTVTPMEPRMIGENLIAAYKALGIDLTDENADPQGTGAQSTPAESGNVNTSTKSTGVIDMDEKELEAKIEARVSAALKAQKDADAEAVKADKERAEAVKAAVAEERKLWEAEAAKARRLPFGGDAPHQTKYGDFSKYDNLNAADQALLVALLGSTTGGIKRVAPPNAVKALALKLAEDKTTIGEVGRNAMKAYGLPAMKADEVQQQDLAGFGDEWVGVAYGQTLWEAIRAGTFVAANIPSIEVPQGMESIFLPLEGADPTFYKVAETTDINSTTKVPNATVTSSQMATGRAQLTLAKMGARVLWSGELQEDSLIPFVTQLRAQLEKAGAEQLEHAIIDGDTTLTASTNINAIDTTPGGTELYTLFNGLRKSPLVTTTANSVSVGTLTAEDYLAVVKLMGTAGLIGADQTKVAFIVDPNTYWKTLELPEIKTRDVFAMPTIENGNLTGIYGYKLYRSFFMHYISAKRMANTAGKIDADTDSNNTTGSILAVRWDQWKLGYRRHMTIETVRIPNADVTEITALARLGLKQRDTEASAIGYNVTV